MSRVSTAGLSGSLRSSRRRARPALRSRLPTPDRISPAGASDRSTRPGVSAAFARISPLVTVLARPRAGPLILALVLTAIWFFTNVRRVSPLDVLPFAWTWLTLWLLLSVGLDLWRRYASLSRRDRRHR